MSRRFAGMLAGVALSAMVPLQADALGGTIVSFTPTSSGSIAFTVSDLTKPALPGSQGYGFSVQLITAISPGTLTLTAPTIAGTGANSISRSAFSASCVATSDPNALFTSAGTVRLGASAVTCGTFAANATGTVKFTVNLFLDDTADSTAFSADTYSAGSLAVTVNAP